MHNAIKKFVREGPGRWTCFEPCTLNTPVGRVQVPIGRTLTRGMEFGVSPFPETRREMIQRGELFGVPAYGWIPARTRVSVDYWIICRGADRVPEQLERPA